MGNRPNLNKDMKVEDFLNYYYLKNELILFCKSEGLQATGSKEELNKVIIHYLKTNEKIVIVKKKKVPCDVVGLNSLIPSNMAFSETNRAFFKRYLGENFRFTVPFQRWLKSNAGKTFKDAIIAYPNLVKSKEIDKQFEYNTYIRDFFLDNKDKSLKEAIICWKYKKSIAGHNRYEKTDLQALK